MFFSTNSSSFVSARDSPMKTPCRVKVTYKTTHTVIPFGNKTSIDFHFLRDLFGITLGRDKERNPTVLRIEIRKDNEICVSKNSFTTPVHIKYSEEEPWKSLLVSDNFILRSIAFVKIDGYEIKLEKILVQPPGEDRQRKFPAPNMTKSSIIRYSHPPTIEKEQQRITSSKIEARASLQLPKTEIDVEKRGLFDQNENIPKNSNVCFWNQQSKNSETEIPILAKKVEHQIENQDQIPEENTKMELDKKIVVNKNRKELQFEKQIVTNMISSPAMNIEIKNDKSQSLEDIPEKMCVEEEKEMQKENFLFTRKNPSPINPEAQMDKNQSSSEVPHKVSGESQSEALNQSLTVKAPSRSETKIDDKPKFEDTLKKKIFDSPSQNKNTTPKKTTPSPTGSEIKIDEKRNSADVLKKRIIDIEEKIQKESPVFRRKVPLPMNPEIKSIKNQNSANIIKKESEENTGTLLEKRNGQSLSDIEEEFETEGQIQKKKIKDEPEQAKDSKVIAEAKKPTTPLDEAPVPVEFRSPVVRKPEIIENTSSSKRSKKKMRITDDEEEKVGAATFLNGCINKEKDNNINKEIKFETKIDKIDEIEESESNFYDDLMVVLNDEGFDEPPAKEQLSFETRKNLTIEKNRKLQKLRKIVDNKRESLNKSSVVKQQMKLEENNPHHKENCPICLSEIIKEIGKLDTCIHVFCFSCIKDWSDVTNECPLCKRRFNEITKFAMKGGALEEIENITVEYKKQKVHEDTEDYIEEEVDECCYECGSNDDQNILLICDSCGFYCCHTYCCNPPLEFIPDEDWYCKFCEQPQTRPNRRNNSRNINNERVNNNTREETADEGILPRRVTRSSSRQDQSLLETLFQLADRRTGRVRRAIQVAEESSSDENEDSGQNSEIQEIPVQTRIERPATRRRLQRNSRAMQAEEQPQRRRRDNSEEKSTSDIERNQNNTEPRRYSTRSQNRTTSRMNVETTSRNSNVPEESTQSRYSLRRSGRVNH